MAVRENWPDNSDAGKNAVEIKEKSLGKRISETFVAEDVESVGTYIVKDVIVPSLKDIIFNSITQSLEMIIFGGKSSGVSRSRTNRPYNSMYKGVSYSSGGRSLSSDTKDIAEISFSSRRLAQEVLNEMQILIESEFAVVSISDYVDIVERVLREAGEDLSGFKPSRNWAYDTKFGWTDLAGVRPQLTRGGRYILTLPKATRLE